MTRAAGPWRLCAAGWRVVQMKLLLWLPQLRFGVWLQWRGLLRVVFQPMMRLPQCGTTELRRHAQMLAQSLLRISPPTHLAPTSLTARALALPGIVLRIA